MPSQVLTRIPAARRPAADRIRLALVALTLAAAALRLYRLGHQSLWFDEAYTAMLVKLPLGRMLSTVPKTESTPYLYYLLNWAWTHVFGRGQADLRLLSALFGTAVVPVAYAAAARLIASRRAGLAVAALAAFNPLLIWYSQEARAYELLVLASACSLLAFAHARERPRPRLLAAWAVASALALASHYDAALVVVPEAIWLLGVHRRRLGPWLACGFVAACGGALLPLLIAQSGRDNATWIARAPLNDRLGQILPQFLLGTGSHAYVLLMWIGFVLAACALVLLARFASSTDRRRALGVGALAVGGFALVMVVDAAGSDTVLTRNLLALWLPTVILLGAGLSAPRAGLAGIAITVALCAVGLTASVSVATDSTLQRPDWAAVARALGPWPPAGASHDATRLLVFQRNVWLESLTQVYMRRTSRLGHGKPRHVTEVDIIANTAPRGSTEHWLCWWGAACNLEPSTLRDSYGIAGFHASSRIHLDQFTILRLVSNRPRRVYQRQIVDALSWLQHPPGKPPLFGLLIQRP